MHVVSVLRVNSVSFNTEVMYVSADDLLEK